MAFVAADKDEILKRVVQAVNGNRELYAAVVSNTGAFPFNDELAETVFEADELIATQGYFQSNNELLSQPFEVMSQNLLFGDDVPFSHGKFSRVDLAQNVKSFLPAAVNTTDDEITITAHGFASESRVRVSSDNALPAPLTATSFYFVSPLSANVFKLYSNFTAPTSIVNLTDQGAGNHTIATLIRGIRELHADSIVAAQAAGKSYVQQDAFDHLYAIENGRFYTTAQFGLIFYPEYTRTSELQCSQNESALLVATTVRLLRRNASPAPFDVWTNESVRGIEQIVREGVYTAQGVMNQ